MRDKVILVDTDDNPCGIEEKLAAHYNPGQRHRAFSVFIINPAGQLLLQQRAAAKYHAGGLWANSCCSHPQPGEVLADSASQRLSEEMGIDVSLQAFATCEYQLPVSDTMTEWELDHLLIGHYDGKVIPNPDEVDNFRWADVSLIAEELRLTPERYAPWFHVIFPRFADHMKDASATARRHQG